MTVFNGGAPDGSSGTTQFGPSNVRTTVLTLDRPGDPSVFGDDVRAAAAELIGRYPAGQGRSALLPLLHLMQAEQGYITPDGIAFCADVLGITKAQVAAVATFYTMYKRTPTGEYLISVCTNPLCGLLGGDEIWARLSERLGIGMNGTTADGVFTIEHAECLAACDYAPVVTVNYEFFDNQDVESTMALVDRLQAGDRPMPTRGAALRSFRETEREIAGFPDLRPESVDAPATGAPTEAGVRLAVQRGESAPGYDISDDDRSPSDPAQPAGSQPAESQSAESQPAGSQPSAGASPAPAPDAEDVAAGQTAGATSEHDAPMQTSASDTRNPAPATDGGSPAGTTSAAGSDAATDSGPAAQPATPDGTVPEAEPESATESAADSGAETTSGPGRAPVRRRRPVRKQTAAHQPTLDSGEDS